LQQNTMARQFHAHQYIFSLDSLFAYHISYPVSVLIWWQQILPSSSHFQSLWSEESVKTLYICWSMLKYDFISPDTI
jgi:hypothetical protein